MNKEMIAFYAMEPKLSFLPPASDLIFGGAGIMRSVQNLYRYRQRLAVYVDSVIAEFANAQASIPPKLYPKKLKGHRNEPNGAIIVQITFKGLGVNLRKNRLCLDSRRVLKRSVYSGRLFPGLGQKRKYSRRAV